jgi:hypothetical protein
MSVSRVIVIPLAWLAIRGIALTLVNVMTRMRDEGGVDESVIAATFYVPVVLFHVLIVLWCRPRSVVVWVGVLAVSYVDYCALLFHWTKTKCCGDDAANAGLAVGAPNFVLAWCVATRLLDPPTATAEADAEAEAEAEPDDVEPMPDARHKARDAPEARREAPEARREAPEACREEPRDDRIRTLLRGSPGGPRPLVVRRDVRGFAIENNGDGYRQTFEQHHHDHRGEERRGRNVNGATYSVGCCT